MSQISESNKRVAKNTVMLYFRMFVMMVIGLFTSRITLQALGVDNYGINNVVGGVVGMFTLITGALINAVSRFLTFELGKKDNSKLNDVFCTSVNVMGMLSLLILIIGETVGLWFLYNKLNIPVDRLDAANVVLQCSIASCIMGLMYIPYNALIIAYEKMSIWAYFSILDVVMKLLVVYALYISPFDKLKTFALLGLAWAILNQVIYRIYCHRTFSVARYHFVYDKPLLKQMFGFASWNFLGQGACVLNNEGVNIVINIFFGVAVNAARGIAMSVNGYVTQFANNFMGALNPQITKSFAAGSYEETHKLIIRGAKFSFFLMLILLLPICLETETVLHLWLGNVPKYAAVFVRWALIISLINSLSTTLITGLHASGNLKRYMIIVGLVEVSNLPITYIAFKLGGGPIFAYIVYFCVYFILMLLRLYLVKDLIFMSGYRYVKEVYLRVLIVSVLAAPLPIIICLLMDDSIIRLMLVSIISMLCSCGSIYLLGLDKHERVMVTTLILNKFFRKNEK